MEFNYFYGLQADMYSNICIPKLLFEHEAFKNMPVASKVLYALMLDRVQDAAKNGWIDEDNHVYVIFPLREAQEVLGITKRGAILYYKILEEYGLIERKIQGKGLPWITYVKEISIEMVPD